MKIIDFLRKLGIIRFGAVSGKYKNYQDMPDELMFDNVYDKKKDLVDHSVQSKQSMNKTSPDGQVITKISAALFWLMITLSIITTLFLGLVIGSGVWLYTIITILIIYLFILYRFKSGTCLIKSPWLSFFIFIIIAIVITVVGVPTSRNREGVDGNRNNTTLNSETNVKQVEMGNDDSTAETLEWIDYTGAKSAILGFKYPKKYTIEEYGTSIIVYVDKTKDYDYHFTISVMDSELPQPTDCYETAKATVAAFEGGEVRYANSYSFGSSVGCENGINITQKGKKIYEIQRTFNGKGRNYGLIAYAAKESDLGILKEVMETFKLK